jgi:hypothetical protein
MVARSALLLLSLLSAANLPAVERWIPIAGTVGVFHTDVRVLNPSTTRDIEITARFFPVGNLDNSSAAAGAGVTFTVPRRGMRVLDDVTALFDTTLLGAIRFTSADEFTASSRIYAQTSTGTLGQSFVAELPAAATTRGTMLQLESTPAFRTNLGAVNIGASPSVVTWRLYDKSNTVVATSTTNMPPFAVIAPSSVASLFAAPGSDLSDAWISFTATSPIFAYASVVDNATTDPTSIPAQHDSGDTPAGTAVFTTSGAFFALNVASVQASAAWYAEKLGLNVILQVPASTGSPAVTVLEGGGLIVELIQRDDAVSPGNTAFRGFTKAGMIVDEFEKTMAALTERGVAIAFGPFPATAEQRANVIVRDNAGNLIQIFGRR